MRTYSEDFEGLALLTMKIRTTGFKGGDAGHGGFAELIFMDRGSTAMELNYKTDEGRIEGGIWLEDVCIRFCGDAEIQHLRDSLLSAACHLDRMLRDDGQQDNPTDPEESS